MSAILNSLNAYCLLIFQPILMILVSKFVVYRALSDKTYLSLGLLSPLTHHYETKKRAHDSQIVTPKENLKLSHSGSSYIKHKAQTY